MTNYDTVFNTSGKFPTNSDFWKSFSTGFVTEQGITPTFSKVLGEQVFRPLGTFETPFYNRFAGSPLWFGSAWRERALYNMNARHFKPKATANDDLDFVDSEGLEVEYKVDVSGWVKCSIPTELETIQMMLTNGEVGQLNDMLVDNVVRTYQMAIESEIGKKLVSNINAEDSIDFTDGIQAVKDINKLAIRMKGNTYHYNQLSEAQNSRLITRSKNVLCFIDADVLEFMRESFASLPSPDRISENVEFIPMYDGCPTPITTSEYNAGGTDASGTVITWDSEPTAINKSKPVAMLVSDEICSYRPLINSYRMGLSRNGAGEFVNQHLQWKGAIGIRPFENAIRLNQSE